MRVGLTGASGVLGRRIAGALLQRGHQLDPFRGDVRDLAALTAWTPTIEVVIHAAARVPVVEVDEWPGDAIAINVGGTANVACAVARSNRCRLVYISTSHVYRPSDRPIAETDPVEPTTSYGLTKLHGEQWALRLVANPLIIRVFSFFDERQSPPYLFPSLCERIVDAERNSTLTVRGATNVRDIADATYLGEICARLSECADGGVINCGTGAGYSVAQLATSLCAVLGRKDVRIAEEPDPLASVLIADTTKLAGRLGAVPRFDLSASVRRVAARLHAQGGA